MSLSKADDAIRRTRLTASEAPALMGLSPWTKCEEAVEKWASKARGETSPVFAAMDRGNRYEDAICLAYLDRMDDFHGKVRCERVPTTVHPQHDWLAATPDRLIWLDVDPDRLLQAKYTDSPASRKKWGDLVPEYVAMQIVVELAVGHAVWKIDRCDVAVDLGGTTWLPTIFKLYRDARLEQDVLEQLHAIYLERLLPLIPKETAHA